MRTPTTVRLNVCCVESVPPGAPDESVTLTVKVEVPPVVGVPKMYPGAVQGHPCRQRSAGQAPIQGLHTAGWPQELV